MSGLIVSLVVLGFVLLLMEVFMPGGILGAAGWILLLASVVVCYMVYGTVIAVVYLLVMLPAALVIAIGGFLFFSRHMALTPPDAMPVVTYVGKEAVVAKTLNPTGTIDLKGKRLAARTTSASESIEKGATVRVVQKDGSFCVVEKQEDGS